MYEAPNLLSRSETTGTLDWIGLVPGPTPGKCLVVVLLNVGNVDEDKERGSGATFWFWSDHQLVSKPGGVRGLHLNHSQVFESPV